MDEALDVGIFVFDGAALDVLGPMRVFSVVNDFRRALDAPAVRVHLVAERDAPVLLAHGPALAPTATFETCPPLDVLVVPGGSSASETV